MNTLEQETVATRMRYARLAPIYDLMEFLPEIRYRAWRKRLWEQVEGSEVLEIGVGTGKNISFYPTGVHVTAIDLTPAMLKRAEQRAAGLSPDIDLQVGDVQDLHFEGDMFDSVIGTFVFCSVPDPVQGLREVLRVTRPGGKALFLEHVRSRIPVLGTLMDIVDPLVAGTMGPHINRQTIENIRSVGLNIERVDDLGFGDIFKLIIARKEVIDG